MKILYTFPLLNPVHGGAIIVMSHLKYLHKIFNHDVCLFIEKGDTTQIEGFENIMVMKDSSVIPLFDIIVIGSPHSNWIMDEIKPHQKCFIFQQMDEIKFRPYDLRWKRECVRFYRSKFPLIHGAKWNEEVLKKWGRTGKTHYLPNGIDFDRFPIKKVEKKDSIVLLESPESPNPAKDVNRLAIKAAKELREMGATIIGYGAHPPKEKVYHDFFVNPNLERLNLLYEKASILLKATRFDHRALSPIEAMTKGCIPVRMIINGDDDLIHDYNCIRLPYGDHESLAGAAQILLDFPEARKEYAENCLTYVSGLSWEPIIKDLNKILIE